MTTLFQKEKTNHTNNFFLFFVSSIYIVLCHFPLVDYQLSVMTEVSNTALLVLLILVLVFVVILVFIFVLCLPWCCPFFFIGCTRRRRLRVAINEFLEEQLDENKEAIHQINDLENQVDNQDPQNNADAASNVALNSFPMNSTHSTRLQPPVSDITVAAAGPIPEMHTPDPIAATAASEGASQSVINDTRDSDFKSVLEEYLAEDTVGEPVIQTIVANPIDQNTDLVSGYDTYSRTVLLQLVTEACRKPNEQIIRSVTDPFSEKLIRIGEKVVVVKPFIGKNDREFGSLQTGDLLRIIKFSIADVADSDATGSIKSIHIGSAKTKCKPNEIKIDTGDQSEYQTEEITVHRSDPNHEKIICTGILLDTYLDFNSHNNELKLKVKEDQEIDGSNDGETIPFELIKEFPLSIVSLETTVVKTALFGDGADSETEF
ncbi:predicted protein [Candida tropicalis MYA-3404]|uniref:Uncharacterized protein n=1 Tax=Candida tropicalis (strain ATCC MYA-3404 / T1) TaxID=294747 RepID=C5M7E0_CANTT|nr:predicted protein [Candida tropicalis MYA-3404]EER34910.1 predicted protein [Candida tropicalis MYA-3404]